MAEAIALNGTCYNNTICTDVEPAVANSECNMSGTEWICTCLTGYRERNGACTSKLLTDCLCFDSPETKAYNYTQAPASVAVIVVVQNIQSY